MADGESLVCPACAETWSPSMRFCGACGTPLIAQSVESELRLLTIMFCDMVGSTELSTRIDPETLADVMRDYYVMCDRLITDAGGYIVKFHGDGVLACFGAPVALDDAPLRAVTAAMDLVAATAEMVDPLGRQLTARAGVHSGQVVVGVTGAGTGQVAIDVLGEAANLASRLQGAAAPGEVVISAETAALVPPHVELVDGADLQLKGIDRLVRAYRVEGIGPPTDELHVRARTDEAGLVAREAELAILIGRCHLAAQGSPQVAVVVGEPGIGKSRLLRELRDSPARPPGRVVIMRGLQDRAATPFAPLVDLVARHGSDLPPALEADLAALLRPDRAADGETPDRLRRRSIDAVCDAFLGLASESFLMLILDDLHWFDPSTFELLAVLRERAADSQLAVLASTRPEWTSPWPSGADVTMLPLQRLSPDAIRQMLAQLSIVDDELVATIIERSEGVPLFLEEYARHRSDDATSDVPNSVADLLRARLERLGPDLDIARDCSVLGRDIDVDVAAEVAGIPSDEMRERLRRLVTASVLRERHRGRMFSFQHVLLRDAAYESQLRSRRTRVHRTAAEAIERLGPTFVARYAEELARHWTEAGAPREAFHAWMRAGRMASDRTALTEATAHFDRAREVLMAQEPSEQRDRDEVRLILAAGPVVRRRLGGGHPSVSEMFERADLLCVGEPDARRRAQVILGLYSFWVSQPDFRRAEITLPRLMELADELPVFAPVAHFFAGSTLHMQGRFSEAMNHLERSIQLAAAGTMVGPTLVFAYGLMGDMIARTDLQAGMAMFDRGFEALEMDGVSPFDRAWLELTVAKSLALQDDVASAAMHAGRAAELGAKYGLAQINVQTECLLAWVDAVLLGGDDPIERMNEALERFDTCGSRADLSMYLLSMARVLRGRGDEAAAIAVLDRAARYEEETGEKLHAVELAAERAALTMSR
ncbi:MAG: AAA family ATPase [Actinobacteria bacterium]|nr:AAA family ATPase [Actinomycetota bacterium]